MFPGSTHAASLIWSSTASWIVLSLKPCARSAAKASSRFGPNGPWAPAAFSVWQVEQEYFWPLGTFRKSSRPLAGGVAEDVLATYGDGTTCLMATTSGAGALAAKTGGRERDRRHQRPGRHRPLRSTFPIAGRDRSCERFHFLAISCVLSCR